MEYVIGGLVTFVVLLVLWTVVLPISEWQVDSLELAMILVGCSVVWPLAIPVIAVMYLIQGLRALAWENRRSRRR